MKHDIKEEMEYILHVVRERPDIYLLEQAIEYKDYPASQVHRWGKGEEYGDIYEKVRDLLHIRIIGMINRGELERGVGLKHLSAFYDYSEKTSVDHTSKGEKVESVVFYIPGNGRDGE